MCIIQSHVFFYLGHKCFESRSEILPLLSTKHQLNCRAHIFHLFFLIVSILGRIWKQARSYPETKQMPDTRIAFTESRDPAFATKKLPYSHDCPTALPPNEKITEEDSPPSISPSTPQNPVRDPTIPSPLENVHTVSSFRPWTVLPSGPYCERAKICVSRWIGRSNPFCRWGGRW